jgi:hypothetical protein
MSGRYYKTYRFRCFRVMLVNSCRGISTQQAPFEGPELFAAGGEFVSRTDTLGRQVLKHRSIQLVGCGGDQGMYSFVSSLQKCWGLVALPH